MNNNLVPLLGRQIGRPCDMPPLVRDDKLPVLRDDILLLQGDDTLFIPEKWHALFQEDHMLQPVRDGELAFLTDMLPILEDYCICFYSSAMFFKFLTGSVLTRLHVDMLPLLIICLYS